MRLGQGVTALVIVMALASAAPAQATLSLTPAFSGGSVSQPMFVTAPPGDSHRLFIVTRPGVIRVAVDGVLQSTPFLDISSNVWTTGEAGMLSMAFDPGYLNPAGPGYGLFYVYYVAKPAGGEANGAIHIAEFSVDVASTPNVANPTGRDVLVIPHNDASNHYGGTLQFSPNDGQLYIGTGDGGGSNNQFGNAQSTKKSLLGKLLRIDPHVAGANPYSIPSGNPFSGQPRCSPPSGTTDCPEILAWGLRNPFRWSFDRVTGDIAIGDVGQDQYEEIDYVPAGGTLAGDNFGWPCYEGPVAYQACSANPRVDPVAWYPHAGLSGSVAITGGVVVRDPNLGSLFGRYLWSDFYIGKVHSLQLATPSAMSTDRLETDLPPVGNLVSFGEDADGHVYVVSLAGSVQRIVCSGTCPAPSGGGGGTGGGGTGSGGTTVPPVSNAGTPVDQVPTGQPPATPAVSDTTPPRLTIRAAHTQDVLHRHTIRFAVVSNERCALRTSGSARGLRIRGALLHLVPGRRILVQIGLASRVRRALVHRGTVKVVLRARDAAGNLRSGSLIVRVKR
jgi:glucose/arabinose dehydrogenase